MQYLVVKNFERFQHYKPHKDGKRAHWIKLFADWWQDDDISSLSYTEQLCLVKLWSTVDAKGCCRYDLDWLAKRFFMDPEEISFEKALDAGLLIATDEPPNGKKKPKEQPKEEDIIARFPCEDMPEGWPLTKQKYHEWNLVYGKHLDLTETLKDARQWLLDNPTKQKKARGMPRYLGNWLRARMRELKNGK